MTNTMNTFIILFGLVSFVNLFTVGQALKTGRSMPAVNGQLQPPLKKSATSTFNRTAAHTGCSIRIKNDLPIPQPLLLIPEGSKDGNDFFLPHGADGIVTVAAGGTMLLACPGKHNGFKIANLGTKTAVATCISGTIFDVNSVSYSFSDLACKRYPDHVARASGNTCYDGTKRHIECGFDVESHFYKLLDICFDDILLTILYSKETIVSGIAGYQKNIPKRNFKHNDFFPVNTATDVYSYTYQYWIFRFISRLFNVTIESNTTSITINSTSYLTRGHLSAKTDFVYGSQQTNNLVNAAPLWQTINAGNWYALESSVRKYAKTNKLNLDVYTGTYGILTFPDVNGTETELYLYVDSNNNKAIPVPKLFWRAVYDPTTQAGVVVVVINNPYLSEPQEDYVICEDVCSQISWLRWDQKNITKGYSYCCVVDDFRCTVNTLPHFNVTRLLT